MPSISIDGEIIKVITQNPMQSLIIAANITIIVLPIFLLFVLYYLLRKMIDQQFRK